MALAHGYDVSDYQGSIPDDAEFVIVKASEGARTEQADYTAKRDEARSRGIVLGHYHFLHAENDVQGEVDHFCRVVGNVPAGELLVLDFEPYGQPVADGAATAAKNAWLAAVKARYPNNRVGLYTSVDWWHRTDDNAADFLWIADYVAAGSPRIQAAWRFHQWTDSPLDSDVYNGTVDDLRAWVGAAASAPALAPGPSASWTTPARVTRDQWGAAAPSGSYTPMTGALGIKIHYLGEDYQFSDHSTCAAYVRKVQAAHMANPSEHWVDIAYNELVCEHGVRFEGRGHDVRSGANGDQTLNSQHYAICALLGSTGSTTPTDAQLNGLRDAIEDYRHNAAAGPEIKGHRDGYSTDCPGGPLYSWVLAGAPRPASQEDDMPFTEADIRRFIREEVTATALPDQVWNHPLPNIVKQADGSWGRDGSSKEAFWWLVWQDVFHAQFMDAVSKVGLTPEQIRQALADGTLHVQVTVAPAATPKGN
ncbi:N-acetylmuramoyl-L-alanine amidase [Kitasatospora aureofaciens]|uniref:GH25 family lysozyme n=1 Tax=Kitasatospora aureofaciens TaxID=1894 RepID=UPI001C456965|nr:GH25 family lysozyme [Kitasatospora aureofaciens]MBV6697425.1 N-acetylmuramoyl-L-alanine amidase [Kitasatospora aureofaciens]